MRIEGTIAKWNNDRGFGFIAPAQGGPDVFVHISAFPQDGIRPNLGDRFSFEIEVDPDGKRRGVRLLRCPRAVVGEPPPDIAPRAKAGAGRAGKLIFLLLVAGLAWYGFAEYSRHRDAKAVRQVLSALARDTGAQLIFSRYMPPSACFSSASASVPLSG